MTAEREAFEYRVLTSDTFSSRPSHYIFRDQRNNTRTTLAEIGLEGWELKGIDDGVFFFARKIEKQ